MMVIMKDVDNNFQFHELRKALLNWYPFKQGSSALLLGNDTDVFSDLLHPFFKNILQYSFPEDLSAKQSDMRFDCVIALDILENSPENAQKRLSSLYNLLTPGGILLLGFRNRWGLKYLCGGLDRGMKIPYSGLTDMDPAYHLYARMEMSELVKKAGFPSVKFYYLMPDPDFVQAVYTDECLPKGSIRDRVFPFDPYQSPFLMSESDLYDDLVREQMLPFHADYYLAECRKQECPGPDRHVIYAALSADRGPENAYATILYSDRTACKKALYPESVPSLERSYANLETLRDRGLKTVDQQLADDRILMPLVEDEQLLVYLQQLLPEGKQDFLDVFDKLYEDILRSSDPGDPSSAALCLEWNDAPEKLGPILRHAYIDMIPYNAFWTGDGFRFYDQEFIVENCPALYVMFRAIRYTWLHIPALEEVLPVSEIKEHFGLTELWGTFQKREDQFVAGNRNYSKYKQLYEWAKTDRQKMDERRAELGRGSAELKRERELLRDVHIVQLKLLREFDNICRKNQLTYMAVHGTLLGAVRHNGFIPWDDDIDVLMPREYYDRLVSLEKSAFSAPFFLQTPKNNYGCYYGGYIKLRYDNTAALEPQNEGRSWGNCHQGIWIDILPLDNCPSDPRKMTRLTKRLRSIQLMIYAKAYSMEAHYPKDIPWGVNRFYHLLSHVIRRRDLIRIFDHLCRNNRPSGYRSVLACYYGSQKNRNIWPASYFDTVEKIPFEDMEIPVPVGWKEMLTQRYGSDFMTLPPENKRYRHKNVAFYPNLEEIENGNK